MKQIPILALLCAAAAPAQQYSFPPEPGAFGAYGADWNTTGGDAQRSSWIRNDRMISTGSVSKPGGFGLLFKIKLDNESKQLNALSQPIIVNQARGGKGFKAMGYLVGASGNAFGFDDETGQVLWKRSLASGGAGSCSGGFTSALTRPAPLVYAEPARGGVGPAQGALANLPGQFKEGSIVSGAGEGAPNIPYAGQYSFTGGLGAGGRGASGPARGGAPGGGGGGRGGVNGVYALSPDGKVHLASFQQGFDVQMEPIALTPPNARVLGFIVVDNIAYAATSDGCGNAANGIWAVTLTGQDHTVTNWPTGGTNFAGSTGIAFGTDGTVYAATTAAITAFEPRTLKVKDSFAPGGTTFNSSPIVLSHGDKELIAASASDGKIYVLDRALLGGVDHKTPLAASAVYTAFDTDFTPGALATFQDAAGTPWILAPAPRGIVAFKVADQGGKPTLVQGWKSAEMMSPLPPVVMNGVVFVLAGGEFLTKDPSVTPDQRARRSVPAVLHALDATTGRELWNSGKTITSFASRTSGVSASVGQVYVTTYDNTLYAFSLSIERQGQ